MTATSPKPLAAPSPGAESQRATALQVRDFAGAGFRRVIDPSFGDVPEHAHDWPMLSLYVMGSYRNRCALGETDLRAPSVIFYGAGAVHANHAGPDGFEQIEIEFDPAWIGIDLVSLRGVVTRRIGGAPAAAAGALARLWTVPEVDEPRLKAATRQLLRIMVQTPPSPRAPWVEGVAARIIQNDPIRVEHLAAQVGLHPVWLGRAFRAATGESVLQAVNRRRVEIAARLLRETSAPPAEVAVMAGFFDQSHMIRGFRRALGRTPREVRIERALFRIAEPAEARVASTRR